RNRFLNRRRGAFADLHHRDDRADADDDAEAGQDRACDVAAQRHQRALERSKELAHDALPSPPASAATGRGGGPPPLGTASIKPSFIQIVRRAAAPTLASWVTRMIVMPSSW